MNILFTASEMVPFCKTGGLADVIGALPPVLAGMGHEVHVMLPGYSTIDRKKHGFKERKEVFRVLVGLGTQPLSISSTVWKGVTIHLLENEVFFNRDGLYGNEEGDYTDNGRRFVFFSRGVIEAARHLGLKPSVIHAHDWQTGMVMPYLATVYANDPWFKATATLLTIHNLGYQGLFPHEIFSLTGIPWEEFKWTKMEYWGKVSFLKSGIVYADGVSTVSPTYAREITSEELGFGMHGVLMERRKDLYGIINGIDREEWSPETDMRIPARYNSGDMSGKKVCRRALLTACGLRANANNPVFGMVTRLDDQKGLDIFEAAAARLVALDIRLVILGTGTKKHHETMAKLSERFHDRIHVILRFDNDMARLIYAGSDAFIMPSKYEPCGLGQLIALQYGTLPVVRATGGLADTVRDLDEHPKNGNGFAFTAYTPEVLVNAAARAVKTFRHSGRKKWNAAVKCGMIEDFSWNASAEKYLNLYIRIRNRRNF